jgi:RHS repeat-associated protein
MPNRKFDNDKYRYGFNGKENSPEISNGAVSFEARIYDSRIGRFFSTDPREAEYAWQSTYVYFKNCPTSVLDLLGMGGKSTHLDPNGHVIAVYNDGDNSIYKHQTAANKEEVDMWRKKFSNTSGNGVKIGETLYWYDFMYTNEKNGTLTDFMFAAKVNIPLSFSKQTLNGIFQKNKVSADLTIFKDGSQLINAIVQDFKDYNFSFGRSGYGIYDNLKRLAALSGNDKPYDIKVTLLIPDQGYLYYTKEDGTNVYTSGRSLGNILFGENIRAARFNFLLLMKDGFIEK